MIGLRPTANKRGGPRKIVSVVAILAACMGFANTACDSTAKFHIKNIKYYRMQSVSAFPAEETSTGHRRVCSGSASAFELNMNFISTAREQSGSLGEGDLDQDQSIRPGDRIDRQEINDASVNAGILDVSMACISPYSFPATTSCSAGASNVTVQLNNLVYEENTALRGDPVSVALVVDHSGSMKGLIYRECSPSDATAGDCFGGQDYKEAPSDSTQTLTGDLKLFASDYDNFRYQVAETDFVNKLNSEDELIVYSFNEKGIKVACTLTEDSAGNPITNELGRADACFGTRRDIFTTAMVDKANQILGVPTGRSNLWEAVDTAWEFMKDNGTGSKHIVVVSDGPDTCFYPNENFLAGSSCSTEGFEDVKTKVETEGDTYGIKISFIQFQAYGYRDPDPRQWEIACLSGGQYTFINSEDLSKLQSGLQDPLREAYLKIRYSLAGTWRGFLKTATLGVDAPFPSGIPLGNVYAFDGTIQLKPSIFVQQSDLLAFTVDASEDHRLTYRKTCNEETHCTPSPNSCQDACSDEGQICTDNGHNKVPNDYYVIGDNLPCTDGGGICCSGTCDATANSCPTE